MKAINVILVLQATTFVFALPIGLAKLGVGPTSNTDWDDGITFCRDGTEQVAELTDNIHLGVCGTDFTAIVERAEEVSGYDVNSAPSPDISAETFGKRDLDLGAQMKWEDELDVGAHAEWNNKINV